MYCRERSAHRRGRPPSSQQKKLVVDHSMRALPHAVWHATHVCSCVRAHVHMHVSATRTGGQAQRTPPRDAGDERDAAEGAGRAAGRGRVAAAPNPGPAAPAGGGFARQEGDPQRP